MATPRNPWPCEARRVGVQTAHDRLLAQTSAPEMHQRIIAMAPEQSQPPMGRGADEVEAAFANITKERADALVVPGIFFADTIANLAIKYRLPSASVLRSFADAGGLLSYGADIPHMYRRSAAFVHKILQGTKPADLPVEQPTKFELVINLNTAKAIGVEVPLFLQQRADEVIE